jgi:hypothetical protein
LGYGERATIAPRTTIDISGVRYDIDDSVSIFCGAAEERFGSSASASGQGVPVPRA